MVNKKIIGTIILVGLTNVISALIANIILSSTVLEAILIGVPFALIVGILSSVRLGLDVPVIDMVKVLYKTRYTSKDLRQFHRAGLKSAVKDLKGSEYEPTKCMKRTDQTLWFMGTLGQKWVKKPEVRSEFRDWLERLEADGGEVRFLIADTEADGYQKLLDMRGDSLSDEADHYHRYAQLQEDYDCIEVRLYSQITTFRMVFIDDNILDISRYQYRDRNDVDTNQAWRDIPHIEIEKESTWSLYAPFRRTFEEIWADSDPTTNEEVTDITSFD